jgi:hypothetical protein
MLPLISVLYCHGSPTRAKPWLVIHRPIRFLLVEQLHDKSVNAHQAKPQEKKRLKVGDNVHLFLSFPDL